MSHLDYHIPRFHLGLLPLITPDMPIRFQLAIADYFDITLRQLTLRHAARLRQLTLRHAAPPDRCAITFILIGLRLRRPLRRRYHYALRHLLMPRLLHD